MSRKKLWIYWENKPGTRKPEYLDMCFDTICLHCSENFDIYLLDQDSVNEHLDLPDTVDNMDILAHKADYIRYELLYRFGGLWLDADTIVLRPLRGPLRHLESHGFVSWTRTLGEPTPAFFMAKAGHKMLEAHVEEMRLKVANGGYDRNDWAGLGGKILFKYSNQHPWYEYGPDMFAPISSKEKEKFFSKNVSPEVLPVNAYTVCLFNNGFPDWFKSMPKEEIINSDMLISKFFRRALGL